MSIKSAPRFVRPAVRRLLAVALGMFVLLSACAADEPVEVAEPRATTAPAEPGDTAVPGATPTPLVVPTIAPASPTATSAPPPTATGVPRGAATATSVPPTATAAPAPPATATPPAPTPTASPGRAHHHDRAHRHGCAIGADRYADSSHPGAYPVDQSRLPRCARRSRRACVVVWRTHLCRRPTAPWMSHNTPGAARSNRLCYSAAAPSRRR